MTIRAGMANLVQHLRALTDAEKEEVTLIGINYWSDEQLQDMLDRNVTFVEDHPLLWQPDTVAGGSIEYHRGLLGFLDTEGTATGTASWRLTTGTGSVITPNTINHTTGEVRFNANQGGSAYYFTGRTFDVYGAAADVWTWRLAHFQGWYDFRSDDQAMSRSQAFEQAQLMEREMRARSGQNVQRGGIRSGAFVRTDIAPW